MIRCLNRMTKCSTVDDKMRPRRILAWNITEVLFSS